MYDRPSKLSPLATLVVWGARRLTLGEKVVWYRDWSLDRGDPDGAYASAQALSDSLGGNLTSGSVDTVRSRLVRLGLQQAFRRKEGRNPGRICLLPDGCARPRSGREAIQFCTLLDDHILAVERGPQAAEVSTHVDSLLNSGSDRKAGGLSGGVGGAPFSKLVENQLPSAVREERTEKGVGSHEPMTEKRGRTPGSGPEHVGDVLRRRKAI